MFNDYGCDLGAPGDQNAKYLIVVTNGELDENIRKQYVGKMAVLFDRVFRHSKIVADKSDTSET